MIVAIFHRNVPVLRKTSALSRLRPLFAAGAALLVLALAVFAVSPEWHDALHEDGAPESEGCAVDLFAHGIALPLGTVAVLPAGIFPRQIDAAIAEEVFLASPRYLLRPERGPPALG